MSRSIFLTFAFLFIIASRYSSADNRSPLEQALIDGFQQVHYAALIENVDSKVKPLADDDTNDDYVLERWQFSARVLETYKGSAATEIHYFIDIEKGESPNLGSKPFIILLCKAEEGFYWPGVGTNFPADENIKQIARNAYKSIENNTAVEQSAGLCKL